jgi:protease IV
MILFWLCICSAFAAPSERPIVPTEGVASVDNSNSIWLNPANLGLHSNPSRILLLRANTDGQQDLSYAGKTGPLGVGLRFYNGEEGTWWTSTTGLSLRLDERIYFGTQLAWQAPEYDENFYTWDMGLSWRPTRWMGVSGVVGNLGTNNEPLSIAEFYRAGLSFNLYEGRLLFNSDYLYTGEGPLAGNIMFGSTADLLPGLRLRVHGSTEGVFGGGLIIGMGQSHVGSYADVRPETGAADVVVQVGRGENDDNLIARGRRVALFELDSPFPYISNATLFGAPPSEEYLSLLRRLHDSAKDPAIQGLVLHIERMSFSLAQIEEIRGVIEEAKAKGKFVIAYLDESTGNAAYFLACAADRIYMHHSADLNLIGLSSERMYLKGLLDLVGIEPEFVRRSEYKSSPEQFTRHEGSSASREQSTDLLDDMFKSFVQAIAEGRQLNEAAVTSLIDSGPHSGEQALSKGLIDGLKYTDEMGNVFDEFFGSHHRMESEYKSIASADGWEASNTIAVVYVTGTIVSGESGEPGLLGAAIWQEPTQSYGNSTMQRRTIPSKLSFCVSTAQGALHLPRKTSGGPLRTSNERESPLLSAWAGLLPRGATMSAQEPRQSMLSLRR